MVNFLVILSVLVASVAYADDTVDQLDQLERQRVILQKQVEISKLQQEISASAPPPPPVSAAVTPMADLATSSLQLIKVVGLATKPKAVFLYNGYRLSSERGDMVLPNIQLRNVTDTYVLLKDTTTGKESVLWLSANNKSG
jgi:type IV pilus biogenesis protein PilP